MRNPRVGDLLHHLEADDAAVLLEAHLVEDRPPHHAEVAVDVAHGEPEEDLDGVVIDAADDDAVQRIGAADLVAVDEIDAVVERAATALPFRRDRTARRRRCRRPARAWPSRSRCAARRRSRGSSRGARCGPRDTCRASSSRISAVLSALPSFTTMTSWSGVSFRAVRSAVITRLAIVPLSLYAGKKILRPFAGLSAGME